MDIQRPMTPGPPMGGGPPPPPSGPGGGPPPSVPPMGGPPPHPPLDVKIGDEEDLGDDQDQDEGQQDTTDFKANLAEHMEDEDLLEISRDLIQGFEDDETSRADWLEQYVDGLDYLGFTSDDRTQPFQGACGVYHPVMTEAIVRFQSNAIMEIFPAAGPVLTKVLGDETPDKIQQAIRIKEELNYQLTENMCEFRTEMEQALFRLPLCGSVFKKTYFDPLTKKPCSYMVPAEDFVVDYNASNLDNVERMTQVIRMSKNKVRKMMRAGQYRKVDLITPVPYVTDGKEKEDELAGKERIGTNPSDERHVLLEFHVHLNLPGAFADPDDVADPYIVTVDKTSEKVLAIYRNWRQEDNDRKPENYFTHYFYMAGLGFYGVGLIHLMGAIAKASTSILRQLIDAGTLSNLPGGLKARGLRIKGGEDPIAPGEWRDVDVPGGSIKDNILPLPYKEPSQVLAGLLQNLIEEGRRIGSIADVDIGTGAQNAPVGTTLALMERSLKVMSAVHARLHASLKRELKLIAAVIGDYMPPKYDWDDQGQYNRQQDFDARVDVIPVSDPNAATQAQRIVQMQAVMQLAQSAPEIYNKKELHRAGLQAIGIKNIDAILPQDQDPPRMDPVQEEMAILTGQPTKVYPDQDHTAHITAHMAAMQDPSIAQKVGQSPNAMSIMSAMESHIADHLANQYRQEIQQQMGVELPPMGQPLPPEVENQVSRLVAQAAVRLKKQHQAESDQQQAQQVMQDPLYQLRVREVAVKEAAQQHQAEKDQNDQMLQMAKEVSKEQIEMVRIKSQEAQTGAKIGADLVTFGAQVDAQTRESAIGLGGQAISEIQGRISDAAQQDHEKTMQDKQQSHEAIQNERDRQHKLQVEKFKASARSRP